MFSNYKVSTIAIVAALSASVMMPASSMAATGNKAEAAPMVIAFADTVSRTEARAMVRDQLRSSGVRDLRLGQTKRRKGAWLVTVTTNAGIAVYVVKVDIASGEMSRA